MTRMLVIALVAGCVDGDSPDAPPPSGDWLSEEGLYTDIVRKRIASEMLELAPSFELWADGAIKRRWLQLPADSQIDTSDAAHWRIPAGAKLFKEFVVDGKRIETRIVERVGVTGTIADYRYGTYAWLPDESDARLAIDGVLDARGTSYDIPPASTCLYCHQSEPGFALGVSAIQLSGDVPLTIEALEERALVTHPVGRRFAIPGDDTTRTALGTLHANCGHCHSQEGIAPFQQLRLVPGDADRVVAETEVFRTTVGVSLSEWSGPSNIALRIAPGDPDASAIYYRMSQRGTDQMPPLATEQRYEAGLRAVRDWIAGL